MTMRRVETAGRVLKDERYRRREVVGIAGRDIGDEYLFYDEADDQVHMLNATARRILLLCDGNRSVADISAVLAREYAVDPGMALDDVRGTVGRLAELGLLEVV